MNNENRRISYTLRYLIRVSLSRYSMKQDVGGTRQILEMFRTFQELPAAAYCLFPELQFFCWPHEIWFAYMGFYTLCHSLAYFFSGVILLRVDDNRLQLSIVNPVTLQLTVRYQKQSSYPVGTLVLSSGIKRPEGEANHSPPSGAEVKNAWCYTFTSPYVFTFYEILDFHCGESRPGGRLSWLRVFVVFLSPSRQVPG
jgi:hypothetical protein